MAIAQKLTLDQFLARPETKPACELIDGEVVQKQMSTIGRSVIQQLLSFVFAVFLREHPLGLCGPELRCIFGPPGAWGRVPDFVFIRTERLADDGWDTSHHGPPDLAVEILSPDDRVGDVVEKILFYLMYGVRLAWLIDPKARTVEAFTPDGRRRLLHEDDILDGGDVLPGFATPVRDILPPPGPLGAQPAQA